MGTQETNVSEKEIATARRDGEPLTSASQERRQETAIAAKHLAAGELFTPPQEEAVARDVLQSMCLESGTGGKMEEDGYRSQRMPSEPRHHRQAQRAGMEQPAAAGAHSPS